MSEPQTLSFTTTHYGPLQVTIEGDQKKDPLIFLPDIALSCEMCYNTFIHYPKLQFMREYFYFIFIDFPFLLPSAESVDYKAPAYDMKNLASDVGEVLTQMGLKYGVGFGSGSGAFIMSELASIRPTFFVGLILLSADGNKPSWSEYIWLKKMQYQLAYFGMASVVNDLLTIYFGHTAIKHSKDLVLSFSEYLNSLKPYNVMKFLEGYTNRKELSDELKKVDCKVLLFVGTDSPYFDGTIKLMNKYNASNTAWIKVQDCGGLVTEERPDAMVTSMILYMQGMGYLVRQQIDTLNQPDIMIGE
jgi:pimeloyl-ACP methyl ester carboxylesterase